MAESRIYKPKSGTYTTNLSVSRIDVNRIRLDWRTSVNTLIDSQILTNAEARDAISRLGSVLGVTITPTAANAAAVEPVLNATMIDRN